MRRERMNRSLPWVLAAGMVAAAAGGVAAQAPKSAQFTITAVQAGPGVQVTVTSKVWMTPTQARADVKNPLTGEVQFLVNDGYFYQLDPKTKQGVKAPLPDEMKKRKDNFDMLFARFAFDAGDVLKKAKKVRTETVAGYKCDVYSSTATQGEATRAVTLWMPQGGKLPFPVKAIKRDTVKKPGATVEESVNITLSGIKLNQSIPASVFAVPKGYKIETAKTPPPPNQK